jgi:thiol:disulfide interchange protein DsbA
MKKFAMIGVLLLCWGSAVQAQPGTPGAYQEGVHYFKLNKAATARKTESVLVTELFSYGCHACNDFEPYIQSWKGRQADDVKLNRIAVGFGRAAWELLAKGYVIAEILGVEEKAHVPMMDAIWKERKQMRTIEELADFYAQYGADREKFLAMDGSFMLGMRQKQNRDKLGLYALKGTPTMIVSGKYKVQTGQAVPNYQAMLSVVDFLVAMERAELAPAAAAASAEATAETASN